MFFVGSLVYSHYSIVSFGMHLYHIAEIGNIYYLLLWVLATWVFQWLKATVQATLGVLPYQNHVIPGAIGLTRGLFILRASAFAILVLQQSHVLDHQYYEDILQLDDLL
jgi:hypothetical protein